MTDQRWQQPTPIGEIVVCARDDVVTSVWFGASAQDLAVASAEPHGRAARAIAKQFDEWFAGRRHELTMAVGLDGAELPVLAHRVYATLREQVPWGETVSYGELAAMSGVPGAARAVGSFMRRNPVPFVIPCHRVVASGHRLGGYGGGATTGGSLDIKRWLLAHEGVTLSL